MSKKKVVHVHVYQLASKREFDIEAETYEEAMEKALRLVKQGKGEVLPPEKEYMAVYYKDKKGYWEGK